MPMSCAVDEAARKVKDEEAIAAESFGRALRQIPTILTDNAGYNSSNLVRLRAVHSEGQSDAGLGFTAFLPLADPSTLSDMNEGTIGSMEALGITESYKLKRQVCLLYILSHSFDHRVDDLLRATPRKREAVYA
jgi:T-complex protein 1 subunit beta